MYNKSEKAADKKKNERNESHHALYSKSVQREFFIVGFIFSVKRPQGKGRLYPHTKQQEQQHITRSLRHLFDGPPARTMIRSKYVPPGGMPMQDPFGRVSSVKSGRSSHASFELKTYTKNCSGILLKASVSVGLAKSSIMAATP